MVSSHVDNEESDLCFTCYLDSAGALGKIEEQYTLVNGVHRGAANTVVAVSPDGHPCKGLMQEQFRGMNILEVGLKNARRESRSLQRVRSIPFSEVDRCRSCSLFRLCYTGGCRAYAVMRTGSLHGYAGDVTAEREELSPKLSTE
ncbi:hypothetical protein CSA37_11555 [Candidatus Fermentibacteria bacterium]|nr:MAG: hypothetical protein CSA37_11555 [Candidatus Fermentibacteria bacterium]